jgi:hypothetical protein
LHGVALVGCQNPLEARASLESHTSGLIAGVAYGACRATGPACPVQSTTISAPLQAGGRHSRPIQRESGGPTGIEPVTFGSKSGTTQPDSCSIAACLRNVRSDVRRDHEPTADGGTALTFTTDYELGSGFLAGVADRLIFERAIERDVRHSSENLKALAEAEIAVTA